MTGHDIAAGRIVSVRLADGWHRIVPGSFSVGPLGFGASADLDVPGFRFEEADTGSPYQPTVLAGPLHSIVAVWQATASIRRPADLHRARAARRGYTDGEALRRQAPLVLQQGT